MIKGGHLHPSDYYRNLRILVINAMGNKCVRCGFTDVRALQIDHINGNGNQDKKKITSTYSKVVLDSILNNEGKYQLLCANCNWIKRAENKEVRVRRIILDDNFEDF